MNRKVVQELSTLGRAAWLGCGLFFGAIAAVSCGGGASLASSEFPKDSTPPDSVPPPDSTPTDTTVRPDTTPPPPPDTTPLPPPSADCAPLAETPGPPVHQGLPFGPATMSGPDFSTQWSGTIYTATDAACLARDLALARRVNARMFISFTGNEQYLRDANGFSLTLWKQRVDRFRNVDLQSYIDDGTILGHFIMDEPSDPSNWSGHTVSLPTIEEMAKYSKEIWPTMPTMIRTWPYYLKGFQFHYLDAVRFHYLDRFSPLDGFIEKNMADARSLGLAIVGGLNVLNGGGKDSGIPGRATGKNGMSADEIRSWGGRFLQEPDLCAFLLWEYDQPYLNRPDIKAALQELAEKARNYPARSCRKP